MPTKRPQLSKKRKLTDYTSEPDLSMKSEKEVTSSPPYPGQSFVVELFLNEQKKVSSTQVLHVNSNEGDGWSNWDEIRLLNFIKKRVGLPTDPLKSPTVATEMRPALVDSKFHLQDMKILNFPDAQATRFIRAGSPFRLKLSYALLDSLLAKKMHYQLYLSAQKVDEQTHHPIIVEQGVLPTAGDSFTFDVIKTELVPGTYHLQAALFVAENGGNQLPQHFNYSSLSRVCQVI